MRGGYRVFASLFRKYEVVNQIQNELQSLLPSHGLLRHLNLLSTEFMRVDIGYLVICKIFFVHSHLLYFLRIFSILP